MSAASPEGDVSPPKKSRWPSMKASPTRPKCSLVGGGQRPHEDRAVAADYQRSSRFFQDLRDRRIDFPRSPAELLESDHASVRVAVRVVDRGRGIAGVSRADPLHEPRV